VFRVRKAPWMSMAVLYRGAHRDDGKVLGVLVQVDAPVLALEADDPTGASITQIFGSHAHAVVCEKPASLAHAIEVAERYLDRWLAHELEEHEQCDCGEIGAKPAPSPRAGSKRRART
jgi:hypothetical protein